MARFLRLVALGIGFYLCLFALRPTTEAADIKAMLATDKLTIADTLLDQDGLNAFYGPRDYRPVWSLNGLTTTKTFDAFITSIGQVIDYHGLDHDDFPLDAMKQLALAADEDSRGKLELLVTDTLLTLAHDLHGDGGQLDDLYVGWTFHRAPVDVPSLLSSAILNNSLNEFINGLPPRSAAYRQLATALQKYREIDARGGWPSIPSGATLRPNDRGARVALVWDRLIAEKIIAAPQDKSVFTAVLAQAITAWQVRNGLEADGHVGLKTLQAMNVPLRVRIDQIRANMERWRHMPDEFPGLRAVVVNIADASLDLFEDGKDVYRGPVVVGRVDRKTPFIDSNVRSMILNPAWHVPTTIAQKDILPKLKKDPHYLEKLGFVIKGHSDDPYGANIRWDQVQESEFNFRLRQSPGDMNSLGRLKFDFDNDFAVYMHGTPHQDLFKKNQRDFSSGCVRLRDPEQIAEILLRGNSGDWTVQKIDDEIASGKTRWVGLANPLPIYFVYWTVFTDEGGDVNFRDDVYNYDGMLMAPPDDQENRANVP